MYVFSYMIIVLIIWKNLQTKELHALQNYKSYYLLLEPFGESSPSTTVNPRLFFTLLTFCDAVTTNKHSSHQTMSLVENYDWSVSFYKQTKITYTGSDTDCYIETPLDDAVLFSTTNDKTCARQNSPSSMELSGIPNKSVWILR